MGGGDETENLSSSPEGIQHTYIWNSYADIGGTDQTDIQLRIIPNDGKTDGHNDTTPSFHVDNIAPTTNDYNGEWHTSDITITLTATDSSGVNETYYIINSGETKSVSEDGQPLIITEGDDTSNLIKRYQVS